MHPELIPGFPIKTYGVCMALGFLAAWQVLAFLCRRTGRSMDALANLLVGLMVSGVLGSRLAYVIEHWSAEFAANPLSVLYIWQGGLMFYGGFIVAAAVFVLWARRRREAKLPVADLLAVVIPLAHAFGRVGCFFYGCCYGRTSSCACAVSFPYRSPAWYEQMRAGAIPATAQASLPVLPTQLFEAASLLALFACLFWLYLRFFRRRTGLVLGCYLVGYAVIRFGLEILRGDPRAAVGPLSISQTISLGVLSAGVLFMAVAFCRKKS